MITNAMSCSVPRVCSLYVQNTIIDDVEKAGRKQNEEDAWSMVLVWWWAGGMLKSFEQEHQCITRRFLHSGIYSLLYINKFLLSTIWQFHIRTVIIQLHIHHVIGQG